ncbi:MAG: right-handed parallel beta-helix repeat-containing protein [Planctomycetota bacterium]|jgi:hypothetical protein
MSVISVLTRLVAAAFVVAGVAQVSAAGEGVIPIDGDSVTAPYAISAPGSYRLTSNLTVGSLNTSAITVTANDVTIDLNGFALIGPGSCTGTGSSISCGSGSGSGINGAAASQVTVRNGGVRGFGSYGIHLQDDCRITGVTVEENGSSGIDVGSGCIIRDTIVLKNGFLGIDATESENAFAGRASVFVGNVANGNQDDGIQTGSGAVFIGNAAFLNGEDGLECGLACAMHENSSDHNEDDGIHSNTGSSITRNATDDNGGYGIFSVVNGAGFGFNAVSTTTGSAGTTSGGINLGNNVCDGGTACP